MKMRTFEDKLFDDLVAAYFKARPGKRRSVNEHKFELTDFEGISDLWYSILKRSYNPSRSVYFPVVEPKAREVFAADFRDRIVHHYIYDKTFPYCDKRLSYESYSCRVGKGTLAAQKRLATHIARVSKNYQVPTTVAKLDLKSYFNSIDRKLLLEVVYGWLEKIYPHKGREYDVVRFLWRKVIMDDPVNGAVFRGDPKKYAKVPSEKKLKNQEPGVGMVIGNLSSQGCSNLFLDIIDRFIYYDLGYRHFVRYVDDIVIVVPTAEKDKLLDDIKLIEGKLGNDLHLQLNQKKTRVQPMEYGVEFLGVVVYPGRIVPGKRIARNARKAFIRFEEGRASEETVVSYLGHLKHINSEKFVAQTFDMLGWGAEEQQN